MPDTPQMPALPEPESFMYQHEDTGQIGYVDPWQIANGFEAANPRLQVIGPLYTADQMHAFRAEGVREALERAAQLCAAERAKHMEQAGRNDGRQSDIAFGSVNSAVRLTIAIRALAAEIQPPQKED